MVSRKCTTTPQPRPYCGFDCPFSDFPPADASGLCRTMAAVYCRKLRKLVNKNGPCMWRVADAADEAKPGARKAKRRKQRQ